MQKFWKTAFVGLAAVSALLGGTARAAGEAWPTKPITFVVPFTPGGITDNTSRVLAKIVGDKLGQPVVVDNRPGAGGSSDLVDVVQNAPDDDTLAGRLTRVGSIGARWCKRVWL